MTLAACRSSAPETSALEAVEFTPSAPSQLESDAGGGLQADAEVTEFLGPAGDSLPWYAEAIGYEVFVRSFYDSDGDGIGDLSGLTQKLDYLNDGDPTTDADLEVDLLWLMPIQASPSYHGYDVTDYGQVEPDYGDAEALQALIEAAQERGIRIIVDLVLNHTSSEHPWFVSAVSERSSQYRDFYVWRDSPAMWTQPWGSGGTWHETSTGWFYGLFWSGMPDLNFENETVKALMIQVARDWLSKGLAGFRLDAVRYLVETGPDSGQKDTPQTHAYWREFREALDTTHPGALLLAEAWADSATTATYFGTESQPEMTTAFDFDLASAMVQSVRMKVASPTKGALRARLTQWGARGHAGSFLTNHDMRRLASRLGTGVEGHKLAASLLMVLPGMPWIYYGQEIGMLNGPGGQDEHKRLPMQWQPGSGAGFTSGSPWMAPQTQQGDAFVSQQLDDPGSLLAHYRALIDLRRAEPALMKGGTALVDLDGDSPECLVLMRRFERETVLLIINFGEETTALDIRHQALHVGTSWSSIWGGAGTLALSEDGTLRVPEVPAQGLLAFKATHDPQGDARR